MKINSFSSTAAVVMILLGCSDPSGAEDPAALERTSLSPSAALARLQAGNRNFISNKLEHPHQTSNRRGQVSTAQHPFAVILACADSRTTPDIIFDQGLGDLFEVRVAGNVLNDEILGSIEYAVDHLGTRLILVLGHKRCGAVTAAKDVIAAKSEAPGHIQSLVKAIAPAVRTTASGDVESIAKTNVQNVTQALQKSNPILEELVAKGKIMVVGAYYDLDTGEVEFFKPDEK